MAMLSRRCVRAVTALLVGLAAPDALAAGLTLDGWAVSACSNFLNDNFEKLECGGGSFAQTSLFFSTNPGTAISSQTHLGAQGSGYQLPGGWDGASARASDTLGQDWTALGLANFVMQVTNESSVPIPLHFSPFITSAMLQLTLQNFVAPDKPPQAYISTSLDSWHGNLFNFLTPHTTWWRYDAALTSHGSDVAPVFNEINLVDPQGVGKLHVGSNVGETATDPLGSNFARRTVIFDPFFGTIDLGDLQPFETTTVSYTIQARVYTGENNPNVNFSTFAPQVEGLAEIQDPFALTGSFLLNGQSIQSLIDGGVQDPSGVPEPPVLFIMICAGLLLIGVVSKERGRYSH